MLVDIHIRPKHHRGGVVLQSCPTDLCIQAFWPLLYYIKTMQVEEVESGKKNFCFK